MQLRHRGFPGQTGPEETAREQVNRKLARRAAREGFVLLKNEGMVLPVDIHTPIALYGAGATHTVKGGSGSGEVNDRGSVSIYEGLKKAGYEITSEAWLLDYRQHYEQLQKQWIQTVSEAIRNVRKDGINDLFDALEQNKFEPGIGAPLDEQKAASDGADLAIYVVSRLAGEGKDRREEKGDYYLSDDELSAITAVCKCYRDVLLVVNAGSIIDLDFTDQLPNITSIIYMVQGGQEGGSAFADILSGQRCPSGKLTDSWPYHYSDYPAGAGFGHKNGDLLKEIYSEGIYVGYRYFDTFEVPVRYPFGYGLTYTTFSLSCKAVEIRDDRVLLRVNARNEGDKYLCKEIVQAYVSPPQGNLPKEFRRLCAFQKTARLAPGAEETVVLDFPLYQMASFDEKSAAYILEKGSYGIWIGDSLENSKLVASIVLDESVTLVQLDHICPRQEAIEEICPDRDALAKREAEWLAKAAELPQIKLAAAAVTTRLVDYSESDETLNGPAGDLVRKMTREQLVALSTGDPDMGQGSETAEAGQSVPGAAAETTHCAEGLGIASIVLADGPAGLRLNKKYYIKDSKIVKQDMLEGFQGGILVKDKEPEEGAQARYQFCTAIPVGTLLAQTWNTDLVREVGAMVAEEMNLFDVTLWLAPGMCIHRNPLCGRNFEYYSEDPYVAGMIAAAMTKGVQSVSGCGTTIKHFCCNNSEDNRMGSDSVISERALREIYIKGFEIAIKESQPMSIMTSYNMVNGVHTANSYDLCTKAARREWGFAGTIMTDWLTTTDSSAGVCTAAGCMKAGNNLVMPGKSEDIASINSALEDESLSMDQLKRNVAETVRVILHSNQYDNPINYAAQFKDLKY